MKKIISIFLVLLLCITNLNICFTIYGSEKESFTYIQSSVSDISSIALFDINSEELLSDGHAIATDGRGILSVSTIKSDKTTLAYGGSNGGLKASNWGINDYWLINTTTQGFNNITFSAQTRSTSTGPLNFDVLYSFDNINYIKIASYKSSSSYADIKFILNDGTETNTLTFPSECNNKDNFYIKLSLSDNLALAGDKNISSVGTNSLNKVNLSGQHNGETLKCTEVYSNFQSNTTLSEDDIIYLYCGTLNADIFYTINNSKEQLYNKDTGIIPDYSTRTVTIKAYSYIDDQKHSKSNIAEFKYNILGKSYVLASFDITDVSMVNSEYINATDGVCIDSAKITSSLPFSYISAGVKLTEWAGGRDNAYFQFQLNTTNYENITLSQMYHRSSSTGPRDFNIYSSIDNTNWTYVAKIQSVNSSSVKPVEFILPDNTTSNKLTFNDECDGAETLYIKFVLASEKSVSDDILSSGSYIFNNIKIEGNELSNTRRCSPVFSDHKETSYVNIGDKISLYCDEENATIHYSTDGINYSIYTEPITIDTLPLQIKAYASHENYRNSERKVFNFYKYYETNSTDPIPEEIVPNGTATIKDIFNFKENTLVKLIGQVTYKYSKEPNGVCDRIILQDIIHGEIVGIELEDNINSESYEIGDIIIVTGKTFFEDDKTIVNSISNIEIVDNFEPFKAQEVSLNDIITKNNEYLSEYIVIKNVFIKSKTETIITLSDENENLIDIIFPAKLPEDFKENYIIDVYCCYTSENGQPIIKTSSSDDYIWTGKSNSNNDNTDSDNLDFKYGDIDSDNKVTMADVVAIQKKIAYLIEFNDLQKKAADVNGDGLNTMIDVTIIQQFIASIIDKFPINL